MQISTTFRKLSLMFSLLCLTFVLSASNYDEAVDGDITGDASNPMPFPVMVGSNVLSATSSSGDIEYFTITIPQFHKLDAINLTAYSDFSNLAFIGVQAGSTFTEPPTGTNVANLLGWFHLGPPLADILPVIGAGPGAIGFTAPLVGPGTYTFWTQQTGPATTYTLDFVIAPCPPATVPTMPEWGLFLFGLLALTLGLVGLYNYRSTMQKA